MDYFILKNKLNFALSSSRHRFGGADTLPDTSYFTEFYSPNRRLPATAYLLEAL
jgi:hypothetical protein